MTQPLALTHKFVSTIPDEIEERTLYVSMDYSTVAHKCCCGCGKEVVTPLSPTDWKLIFDGESISLNPSIGNWGFECRSHYWIDRSIVKFASQWSEERIEAGRAWDGRSKKEYFSAEPMSTRNEDPDCVGVPSRPKPRRSLGSWVARWWSQ